MVHVPRCGSPSNGVVNEWWTRALVMFTVCGGIAGPSVGSAQGRATVRVPLTVQPQTMATGTSNPAAGEYLLDSLPDMTPAVQAHPYWVYVPAKCVGARRCPLIVHLHGAGRNSTDGYAYRDAADKYGLIILAPSAVRTVWAVGRPGIFSLTEFEPDRKNIDAALHQVLRRFAIDPDKIVISGVSQGCWPAAILGGTNMHVFHRIIMFGGPPTVDELDPPSARVELLSIIEDPFAYQVMAYERAIERAGYRSRLLAALVGHGVNPTTADFVGAWLQAGWAHPVLAQRPQPRVLDTIPVLTPHALAQFTALWPRLSAMLDTQRMAFGRETAVPMLGARFPMTTLMLDVPAAAAAVPAVAQLLTQAGVTATQLDAIRLALLSARLSAVDTATLPTGNAVTGGWPLTHGGVSDTVLWRNMEFVKANAPFGSITSFFTDGNTDQRSFFKEGN